MNVDNIHSFNMYDSKLHLMVRFQFWNSGKCLVSLLLPLLPGPL